MVATGVNESGFASNLRLVDVRHTWGLHFVFLVLDLVGQAYGSAGVLTIELFSLLDRCETRLLNVEVTVDVGALGRRASLLFVFESGQGQVDFLSVGLSSLLLEIGQGTHFGNLLRKGVLRVRASDGQEVVRVDDNSALLHDAERALRPRLLHVPNHLRVDALQTHHGQKNPLSSHLHS